MEEMKTIEERVEHYTKALNLPKGDPPSYFDVFKVSQNGFTPSGGVEKQKNQKLAGAHNLIHLQKRLKDLEIDEVYMQSGDRYVKGDYPVLSFYNSSSYRPQTTFYGGEGHELNGTPCSELRNSYGIPFKAHQKRWWDDYEAYMPYDERLDCCKWAGAFNGFRNSIGSRARMVKLWADVREDLVIKVSPPGKDRKFGIGHQTGSRFNSKFLISAPGNMNDSGLYWKLRSGAVVIMPRPTVHTWLMEETLVPNVHYIQVKDDWSNLGDKIDLLKSNHKRNKEISRMAFEFTNQFKDEERELEIENRIIKNYYDKIKE